MDALDTLRTLFTLRASGADRTGFALRAFQRCKLCSGKIRIFESIALFAALSLRSGCARRPLQLRKLFRREIIIGKRRALGACRTCITFFTLGSCCAGNSLRTNRTSIALVALCAIRTGGACITLGTCRSLLSLRAARNAKRQRGNIARARPSRRGVRARRQRFDGHIGLRKLFHHFIHSAARFQRRSSGLRGCIPGIQYRGKLTLYIHNQLVQRGKRLILLLADFDISKGIQNFNLTAARLPVYRVLVRILTHAVQFKLYVADVRRHQAVQHPSDIDFIRRHFIQRFRQRNLLHSRRIKIMYIPRQCRQIHAAIIARNDKLHHMRPRITAHQTQNSLYAGTLFRSEYNLGHAHTSILRAV